MRVSALFCALILSCTSISCVAAEPDFFEHYVVIRTETVKRLPRDETGNISPWKLLEAGPDEIVISNSCGFAEYSYIAVKLEDYAGYFGTVFEMDDLPTIRARGHLGEWCRLQPFLYEKPTLVKIAYWKGTAYIYRDVDIHWDENDDEYIDDQREIEDNNWTGKLTSIGDPTNSSSCLTADSAPSGLFEFFIARPNVQQYGDKYCYSKGVYMRDLSRRWTETDFIERVE